MHGKQKVKQRLNFPLAGANIIFYAWDIQITLEGGS